MRIEWLGHSAFKLTSDEGVAVLTDPYDPNCYAGTLRYRPIQDKVQIVTVSHNHPDHAFPQGLPGAPVILTTQPRYTHGDIRAESFPAFHDDAEGKKRGEIRVFVFRISGITVGHCGDLGAIPPPTTLTALKNLDVLLVPIGGTFTIDADQALELIRQATPSCVIPMHYKTQQCGFDIDGIGPLLKKAPEARILKKSILEITADRREKGIVILEPSH